MDKILVTGGLGFLGHHLVNYLIDYTDYEIVILDRIDESSTLERIVIDSRVEFVWHDLKAEINNYISNRVGNPNVILHLAAGSHVDRSIENPMSFVMDNVVGTCNILNYAKELDSLHNFIYFSTDEVYGPAISNHSFNEWDRYKSQNPYAATKAGGEELALSYQNTYGLPLMITHCMNMFGERQHYEKFIPSTIKKLLNNEIISIHANPELTLPGSRTYMHALTTSNAIDFLMKKANSLVSGEKYNIVSGTELNNLEVAQKIADIMEVNLNYKLTLDRLGYDFRYDIDGSKLKNLGWIDNSNFNDDLVDTVEWFLDNKDWL